MRSLIIIPLAALSLILSVAAQEKDQMKEVEEWIARLDDDDPAVREEATAKLTAIGAPALKPLSKALTHASAEVRGRARRILSAFKYNDPAFVLTVAALGSDAVPLLKEVVERNNPAETPLAVDALGRIGGDEAFAILEKLKSHADPEVRIETARALARFKTGKALAVIRGLVADAVPRVKASALRALGEAGDDTAIPTLLTHLESNDPALFGAANDALIDLAKTSNIPAIAKGLTKENTFVQRICVSLLGRIGDKAGLEAVKTLYAGAKEEKVRRDAEWALREIAKKNEDLKKEIDALLGAKGK